MNRHLPAVSKSMACDCESEMGWASQRSIMRRVDAKVSFLVKLDVWIEVSRR